ncbi:Uncharacterised protein [Yersinia frederiksenii]|nr:Uncharacterised protein [Yersinia frederiksenii]CNH57880.1 Uncharacterised protein [Yersinia frederiksenii]CNH59351.1 Uncharacterised protein [Yersinia frederiksenii]CNI37576.1 Uncharacterised protein [Yersinia frederiksenii]CNL21327.1 Uncharacterised protein [Yersinia frederiksenii]
MLIPYRKRAEIKIVMEISSYLILTIINMMLIQLAAHFISIKIVVK